MNLLDTNVVIRFLTNDDPKLADQADTLLNQSAPNTIELTAVVFIEIAFVLISNYQMSKQKLVEVLTLLLELKSISCERILLRETLAVFEEYSISIVDSYLLAKIRLGKNESVITFDKRLRALAVS